MKKTSTYSTQTFTESKIRPSSLANIEELEQPLQMYQINRILYSNQKKKNPQLYATMPMNPSDLMVSEISQTQTIHSLSPLI